ncbi:MAG: group I intron-associated PD-(D/E)XK endonuclease [Chloroflexota bacterium]
MRDTSSVGQIGEAAVMQRLITEGWQVLIPYGNSAPYDLAAEKDGRFVRIQVRTTRTEDSFISANCRTKNNRVHAQGGGFDFLVVYELNGDAAFVIHEDEIIGKSVFHIRLSPSLSGQVQGTHPAEDYRERWDKLDVV